MKTVEIELEKGGKVIHLNPDAVAVVEAHPASAITAIFLTSGVIIEVHRPKADVISLLETGKLPEKKEGGK